jgi:glycosyltransferase involved in cell wall biosynthesis
MPNNSTSGNPPHPAVSIIIPAYKAAGHVGSALASVFAQTFTDFEVIVINDGSPDGEQMESVISPYLGRIVYLKQPNRGPSAARNLGIQHARAEFLAFLDSDDTWLSDYLAEQIRFLKNNPAQDMVYCDALFLGNTSPSGRTFMELCPSNGPVTFDSLLVEETQVITSGTVARRKLVVQAGLFDENLRCAEDHDLWLRIAYRGGNIAYQRKVLVQHLVHSDSQGSPPGSLVAGEIAVLKKLGRELNLNAHTRSLLTEKLQKAEALLAWIQGKNYLLTGEYEKAHELLSQANAVMPTVKLRSLLLALRTAPRLTGFGAQMWKRVLSD